MKVSLIGPMTGLPDWNYPMFHAAAGHLRALGHDVFNPAETFGGDTSYPRKEYMRASVGALLSAQVAVVLPGWEDSEGAVLEEQVAAELGLPVLPLEVFGAVKA